MKNGLWEGFFFQAEDGIRDFCLSRGLGDVYKRQDNYRKICRFSNFSGTSRYVQNPGPLLKIAQ